MEEFVQTPEGNFKYEVPVQKPDWNDWEEFLRHWEGDLAIHPVVRERILRKLFNIKR